MSRQLAWDSLSSDGFWMVNKRIAKHLDSKDAAALLADLLARERYFSGRGMLDEAGGFFIDGGEDAFSDEMVYGVKALRRDKKVLQKAGFVIILKRGVPARHWFYLQHHEILAALGVTSTVPEGGTGNSPGESAGTPPEVSAINKNENEKPEQRVANFVIRYFNTVTGSQERVTVAKVREIRATINQYGLKKLLYAIHNLSRDEWSIENRAINLSRLIKTEKGKRERNMQRFGIRPEWWHRRSAPVVVKKKNIEADVAIERERDATTAKRWSK